MSRRAVAAALEILENDLDRIRRRALRRLKLEIRLSADSPLAKDSANPYPLCPFESGDHDPFFNPLRFGKYGAPPRSLV